MSADVLIVDDDRLSRRLLAKYIEAAGYVVRQAESGEQALSMYEDKRPDVVLLDVIMPGIDGYETARRMKSMSEETYVPILLLTALTEADCLARGLAAGADDFLSKPYNRTVLESRLRAALRTKRLFSDLAETTSELQELNDRATKDLHLAEKVMARFIHSDLLGAPFIRYRCVPTAIFNGDLLMAEVTPNGLMRVMLADFAGHGLAASIGGQPMASMFRSMTHEGHSVESILDTANLQLKSFLPPELFLAVCIVELNPAERTMTAWNAGMPSVLVRGVDGRLKANFTSSFIPLGIVHQTFDCDAEHSRVELEDGDRIYLHSDGFTEATNADNEEFGEARFLEGLLQPVDGEAVFPGLLEKHSRFVNRKPAVDDVTIVEIRQDHRSMASFVKSSAPKSGFQMAVTLGPEILTVQDPVRTIENLLQSIPLLRDHHSFKFVLFELVSNAIDHGLLGLDSELKRGPNGFERYYSLREERLKKLESGRLQVELEIRDEDASEIILRVQDSGSGFDVGSLDIRGLRAPSEQPHGRGIELAAQLCKAITYYGSGNRVEALLSRTDTSGAEGASQTAK